MPDPVMLSDFISVRGRFLRSTHLERDFQADAVSDYFLTESAYNLLKAFSAGFAQQSERAMMLLGPYGAGKSAFCAYLAHTLAKGKTAAPALQQLAAADTALAARLRAQRPLLPVLIVGSRQPLGQALIAGLLRSLEQGGYARLLAQLRAEATETLNGSPPTARQIADLFALTACLARKMEGVGGLLLVVDELGKFLEYATLDPHRGDIFVLQELAEAAARSGDDAFFVLGALHQNPDAYAQKLGKTHQSEWAKIGERFRSLPFFPSDAEYQEMVAHALEVRDGLTLPAAFDALIQKCIEQALPPIGIRSRFARNARAAYPLHPVTLLALPALFRRTGQSHRSLFSFLAGEEPDAFGRFLREMPATRDALPLYPLDRLFDYSAAMLAGGWGASGVARQWAEATELIDRIENITLPERRLLKCIGLLNILRDPRLRANAATLTLCLTGIDNETSPVQEALHALIQRQLIVYSRSRDLFRLWEGGDVDIEEELAKARQAHVVSAALHAAQEICPPPRLIARRHSYLTGTLRAVRAQACDAGQLDGSIAQAGESLSILLCLAQTPEEREMAERRARELKSPNLLIGLAQETDWLREAAGDVLALHRVESETPALAGDRAARRELAARRFEAETAFHAEWNRLFGVREGGAQWFYQGECRDFEGTKAFLAFLSHMADRSYFHAPHLRNELINRRQLSSAAAAARRTLIEAMLTQEAQPRLGIPGAPPELSMYECLLRATGLHHELAPGVWAFREPEEESVAALRPCWNALAEMVFADPPAPRPVTTLYERLSAPPYGITEGVLPVLLCAFLSTYREETTLYREGTYLPEPGVPDFEVLLRRPELFAVAGARLSGERALVVRRLADRLNLPPHAASIARALLKMVKGLPEYAWKTRRLPETVLAMREVFSRARSPEQMLFHDLPLALQVTFFSQENVDIQEVEAFFAALNAGLQTWGQALPRAMEVARNQLLQACGLAPDAVGWEELRRRAVALEGSVAHPTLLPVLRRAAEPGDDVTILDKALAQVANRPPRTWTDMDADRFAGQAAHIGDLFRAAIEALEHPVTIEPAALTEEERREARRLTERLRGQFAREPVPPQILRAALVAFLAEGANNL